MELSCHVRKHEEERLPFSTLTRGKLEDYFFSFDNYIDLPHLVNIELLDGVYILSI